MAKRFIKPGINWIEMEKVVPPEQRNKYLAFKGRSDAYFRRMNASPPEAPKIDWEYYKNVVPVPGLVDKFKSQYEAFKVPYPEDKYTKEVDAQWSKLQGEIKKFVAEMQKEIDTAMKDLNRIKALPKFEDMTMETFAEMYPNEALDPVNKPTFWPHNPEEQLGYKPPQPGPK